MPVTPSPVMAPRAFMEYAASKNQSPGDTSGYAVLPRSQRCLTAFSASTTPLLPLVFVRSFSGSWMGVAVRYIALQASSTVATGSAANRSAKTPETIGAAIEVPLALE